MSYENRPDAISIERKYSKILFFFRGGRKVLAYIDSVNVLPKLMVGWKW
jgi:hypothetical protein